MPDGMKSESAKPDANVQNEFSPSESDGESTNSVLQGGSESDADGDDVVGSVARIDPFYCDTEKRKQLITFVSRLGSKDRVNFMKAPLPLGIWLECYIDRIRIGATKFNRKFSFHIEGGTILAVCVKRKRNTTANYMVSTEPMFEDKSSAFYVGKIRSNFLGSEFMAYDNGLNPKKLNKQRGHGGAGLHHECREELVAVSYESGLLGKKKRGPRNMRIVLPHVKEINDIHERIQCKALAPDVDGLKALADNHSQVSISTGKDPLVRTYCNKNAVWNQRMKSYVLNFNNRVGQASVKNFQMVPTEDHNDIVLQFGRAHDDNRFHLDFRYPLSPFQALSIAISSMDYKLCSE